MDHKYTPIQLALFPVEPTEKRCTKCGEVKALSEFHKWSQARDGYRPDCKHCRKTESKEYYWRDSELQRHRMLERRKQNPNYMKRYSRPPTQCAACGQIKDVSEFGIAPKRKNGLEPYCKACRQSKRALMADHLKAYHRQHYLQNRDRILEQTRQWGQSHPEIRKQISRRYGSKRRAWKRNSPGAYTVREWNALCVQYDFHCLRCKRRAPDIDLTADHVMPLSKGGSNSIDNIQPLCLHCNLSKHARYIDYRPGWQL